jgi:hypothetical protein
VQDDEAGGDADARSKQEDGRQGFRLSEHERSYAQATDVKHRGHRELAPELVHDGGRQNKAGNLCVNQHDMNEKDTLGRIG